MKKRQNFSLILDSRRSRWWRKVSE